MDTQPLSKPIESFTKDNFDKDEWNSIISIISNLNDTDTNQTMVALQKVLQLVQELNTCTSFKNYFGDASISQYFFAIFFPGFVNRILNTDRVGNLRILQLSNACLEQIALLWSKAIYEDHAELNNMAATLFKVDQPYFNSNNKEDILPSVISSFPESPSQEHLAWIQTLKLGDLVDCIKQSTEFGENIVCWSHAEIVKVSADVIRVAFLQDGEDSGIKDLSAVLNANEIAPYKTRCTDFEWRMSLKQGDELDTLDMRNIWECSTVIYVRTTLNKKTNKTYKSLLIGYRKYGENANKIDFYGRKYVGWSNKFDEWIVASSPRLCRKGAILTNDSVYQKEGSQPYALTRPRISKSTFLVKMINSFGAEGGFDKILKRIQDTQNHAPIEVVIQLVSLVSSFCKLLFRDFVLEYIPELKDAVWSYLLDGPKTRFEELTQKHIEIITGAFNLMLRIIYSTTQSDEMLETLALELNILCACSDSPRASAQGVIALSAMTREGWKFLTPQYIIKQVLENKIIEKINGSQSTPHIIQAATQLFAFMINQEKCSTAVFPAFFNAVRKANETIRSAAYALFTSWRVKLSNSQVEFIITKITEVPFGEVDLCEIEILHNLSRRTTLAPGLAEKIIWFTANCIVYDSQNSNRHVIMLIDLIGGLFERWNDEQGHIELLCECVHNFKQGNAVMSSILIMRKIIDKVFANYFSTNNLKERLMEELFINNSIIHILLTEFISAFKGKGEHSLHQEITIANTELEFLEPFFGRLKFIREMALRSKDQLPISLFAKDMIINFLNAIKDAGISHQQFLNELEINWDFIDIEDLILLLDKVLKGLDTE